MPEPSLTVVMPSYNAASTIVRSLDSIRSQGRDDVEVVVVDGGSIDGTVEILRGRPDVRWVSEPDRGLSDAYNKGAAMARGPVLGWLNADDTYLPGALDAVVGAFATRPDLVWLTGRWKLTGHVEGAWQPGGAAERCEGGTCLDGGMLARIPGRSLGAGLGVAVALGDPL